MHRRGSSNVERLMRYASLKLPGALALLTLAAPALADEAVASKKPATAAAPKPADAAPKGFVTIVCNPSCDDVVVGGRSLGPSPIVRAEVPAGTQKVLLRRKSQANMETVLEVKAGEVASLKARLPVQKAPSDAPPPEIAAEIAKRTIQADGWLSVLCDPGCDEVIVDGKRKLGRAPHDNVALSSGKHELTFKLKGAADKVVTVQIVSGQTTALRASMAIPKAAPAKP